MAEHWTCPACGDLNAAGIFVCNGFGEEPHEDVWMIDVLRGETKEARAELAAARERARSAIHAAYRHGYARGHSHAETHQPRFQPHLEADLYMQELPVAVSEWLAAPTTAAHTGGGEHGSR